MQVQQVTLSPLNPVTLADVLEPLFSVNLRMPREPDDNAIEYRNVILLGAQGSGKTTTAQALAWILGRKYGMSNVVFAMQVAGIDRLLDVPTRTPGRCWLLCAEDITLAKIPREQINQFFQVRHLIQQYTGLREGMCVTIFNSHTFHGLEKNLRDTFDVLIIKSVPTNPYDRSILKRYFDAQLLDQFSQEWRLDKCLVWTAKCLHGVLTHVDAPPIGSIENVTVRRSLWSRLFGSGKQ